MKVYTPKLPIRIAVLGCCMVVLALVFTTAFAKGYPTGWSTHSFVGWMLGWLLGLYGSTAAIAIMFAVWSIPQFQGDPVLSKVSIVGAIAVAFLSAFGFIVGWEGRHVSDDSTIRLWLILNFLCLGSLLTLGALAKRKNSWFITVGFNFVLFLWFWCWAFPWMGEYM
jgi:hypothetical protein